MAEQRKVKHSKVAAIEEVGLLAALTLVLWVAALAVGVVGIVLGSTARPPAKIAQAPPQVLDVDLTAAPPDLPQPTAKTAPPAPQQRVMSFAPPSAPLVALPSPQIAFAQPVAGPVRISSGRPAPVLNAARATTNGPVVQQLVFGRGEPAQPLPEYPIEAALADQEGTVGVVFTVEPDGGVSDVRLTSPCQWSLLNEAALRAVRETWHFNPGPTRRYTYSIQFVHAH